MPTSGTVRAGTAAAAATDTFGYGGVAVDTLYRSTDGGRSRVSLKDTAVIDVSETPYPNRGEGKATFGWWIQVVAVDPAVCHAYDTDSGEPA
ncbi:hypothetical protein [Streptomyces sp. NPDC046727]|uniref:hypothetical protein n=1 Tax=Streptomyces sp. NPDC046727 TaxID=3155373 RepID=UPI0033ED451B